MLDTREKVIDAAQAARIAASGATVISGYFDPLIASHAERLAELKPEVALYVGGMGHKDKNFHKDQMVRRGFAEAADRIRNSIWRIARKKRSQRCRMNGSI